jgi:tetratricopeptide (TPR) repeat protein
MRFCGRSGAGIIGLAAFALVAAFAPGIPSQAARRPDSNSGAAPHANADTSAILQTAQHQFGLGNYAVAISTLQSAITQNPASAELYHWLSRSYFELRDWDNAISQEEKAIGLDAKNSLYHMWLGRAYGGKADRDRSFSAARRSKKEFEDAVALNPSNIVARRDLEEYCISAPWVAGGSKDEAKAQADAVAALDPTEGHLARGLYDEEALKRPDLAEAEYRQALSAHPKDMDAYVDVIKFYEHQKQPADMEAVIKSAEQLDAKDARLTYLRGVAKVIAGNDLAHAEEFLKAYIASTPERSDWPSHASAREWLGKLYEAEGKRAEAAEQYQAALALEPGRKESRNRLAQLEKGSR